MSLDDPMQLLAAVFFGSGFLVLAPALIWGALMALTLPKELQAKYLRPPHFTQKEIVLYEPFPLSVLKFAAFARAIVAPRSMSARQMENIRNYTPRWYRWLVTGWMVTFMAGFLVMTFCTIALLVLPD